MLRSVAGLQPVLFLGSACLAATLSCVPPPASGTDRDASPSHTADQEPASASAAAGNDNAKTRAAAKAPATTGATPKSGSPSAEGPQFAIATAEGNVAEYVSAQRKALASVGRVPIVYVGAPWCEPCKRFHDAVVAGEFDDDLAAVTLLEFDADRDMDQLRDAGYGFRYVPLFVIPDESGRASQFRVEGSVKGPAAVENLRPRLQKMLAGATG